MAASCVRIGQDDIASNLLAEVIVRQRLNAHWTCHVAYRATPDNRPDVEQMHGQPLRIATLSLDGTEHVIFSGIIRTAHLTHEVWGSYTARVEAVSLCWLMDIGQRHAYYLKQSPQQIAQTLAGNIGLEFIGSIEGDATASRVQWAESDYNFFRQLVDDGEAWLRPTETGIETQSNFQPGVTVQWRQGEYGLLEFQTSGKVVPRQITGSHYDATAMQSQQYAAIQSEAAFYPDAVPSLVNKALAVSAATATGTHLDRNRAITLDHYQQRLQLESRRAAVNSVICHGISREPQVMAGNEITIAGLPGASGTYGVIACTHQWTSQGYENHFTATPAKRWFAAVRVPRALASGLYPARVAANHDPHNQGRMQIQYWWLDDTPTTWARFLTAHAGADRGLLWYPELGDEVAVRFEENDPERPVIVGSLWNGVHQPPTQGYWQTGKSNDGEFASNDIKRIVTKSGIRITFNDTPGREAITLATPTSNQLTMTEKTNETSRSGLVLHTTGDILISASNGRIHARSMTQSQEVGDGNLETGIQNAASSAKPHPGAAASSPSIPPKCSYLNKGFRVQAPSSGFSSIRKPSKLGKPVKTTFQFPGDSKPQAATSQTITIGNHTVTEIRSDAAPQEPGTVLPSTSTVAGALGSVPSVQYGYIKQVVVSPNRSPNDAYWAKTYNMPGFRSEADAGPDGTVHFYPIPNNVSMIPDETMIHESGHAFSGNIWPKQTDWQSWDAAMKKDGRSVSQYADSSDKEDFSESLVMYSLSKGTPCEAVARKLFPNRYKILDQVLTPKSPPKKPGGKGK